jgi:tetratricopeptide (TPR) repeat protein
MDAARTLAGPLEARLSPDDRAKFARALDEYVAAQRFNADRPEAHVNLGALHAVRNQPDAAIEAYRKALAIEPTFVAASINLADVQRALGNDAAAEQTLREALKRSPQSAPLHHALGLSLVRQKRIADAVAELGTAAKLAPDDARLAYVYGIALYDTGKRAEAMKVLTAALARQPYDRDILFALASYERSAGNVPKAREYARLLGELEPDNRAFRQLAAELGATQ